MIRPRQTVYPFADKRSGFVFRLFLGIKKGGGCGVFLASVYVLDRERQGDGVVKKLSPFALYRSTKSFGIVF